MSPSLLNPKFGKAAWLVAVMVVAAASLSNPARTQQSAAKVSKPEVVGLLKSGMTSGQLRDLVRRYGVSFEMTADNEKELRDAGANDELIKVLQEIAPGPASATTPSPAAAEPAPAHVPAPAPAGPPVLVVEASPGGAQVYVDDEPVGKTSSEGRLKLSSLAAGEHRLRLSLDGYRDHEQSLSLVGGETVRLVVKLESSKPAAPAVQTPATSAVKPFQLNDWTGFWVFVRPAESRVYCGKYGGTQNVDLSFRVLGVSPSGEVRAQFYKILQVEQTSSASPIWTGRATDSGLELAPSPAPRGSPISSGKLQSITGRLEASRSGERFNAAFSYSVTYRVGSFPIRFDCDGNYRYEGTIRREE